MTRKTMRGITGKTNVTNKTRPKIGPGISFTQMNLTNGDEIKKAAEEVDWEPDK